MNLILEIVNSPSFDIFQNSVTFDTRGGKIGRSKKAKWTLNDPSKIISSFHADISHKDGQYFITDISTNGTFFKTPYKRFVKDTPVPLNEKSTIMIGEYEIAVKTIESAFAEPPSGALSNMSGSAPAPSGIPDTFFSGDIHKETFGIIEPAATEEKDVLSLLDGKGSFSLGGEDMFLPELDSIMGSDNEGADAVLNDSLSTHIEPPTFESSTIPEETPQANTHSVPHDHTLKILSLKLGIDVDHLNQKEKEKFVSEIAELALVSLESIRHTRTSMAKIQKQLGVPTPPVIGTGNINPIEMASDTKEILANIHNYSPSISYYIKDIYSEIDTHNIAFYTAFKNVSLGLAKKFSPQNLYFDFERNDALNKNFTNKKALAWEAYCKRFEYLDNTKDENIDFKELQKEYKVILETLNLGYNT